MTFTLYPLSLTLPLIPLAQRIGLTAEAFGPSPCTTQIGGEGMACLMLAPAFTARLRLKRTPLQERSGLELSISFTFYCKFAAGELMLDTQKVRSLVSLNRFPAVRALSTCHAFRRRSSLHEL